MRAWREAFGDRFYQVYFQEPGVAEAELEADVAETMRRMLVGASGDRPPGGDDPRLPPGVLPEGGGFLDVAARRRRAARLADRGGPRRSTSPSSRGPASPAG